MNRWSQALCLLPFLALFFAGCVYSPHFYSDMTTMSESRPREGEKALESTIRFDVGSIEISGEKDPHPLYSLDLEYDRSAFRPDIGYSAGSSGEKGRFSFNLGGDHRPGLRSDQFDNRLSLRFTETIPLDLNVQAGVGNARLSLSGLMLSHMELESGVGGGKISVFEPNPISCDRIRIKNGVGSIEAVGLGNLDFREFEFDGGVGGADLDFTGEWKRDASIYVHVGVGGVNVRMPRSIGVRVDAEKNFLSGMHLEGFSHSGTGYYSENYGSAPVKVYLRIITGIGGFKISWI